MLSTLRTWSGALRACRRVSALGIAAALLNVVAAILAPASADGRLAEFLQRVPPQELFPGADRFGPVEGTPPAVAAYKGDRLAGYVFLNSDYADATGYSGKPIEILLGLDLQGVVTGARLVEHHEPIVLIGIPQGRVDKFIAGYIGTNLLQAHTTTVEKPARIDVISGATVTVMIISDSIARAGLALAESRGLIGGGADAAQAAAAGSGAGRQVDPTRTGIEDWSALTADGSVQRLHLSVAQINDAFGHSGNDAAAARPEPGDPADDFIDLYVAIASVPAIGRSLLGDDIDRQLRQDLHPGQQALLVAGLGRYSFKGSGYVRGGVFDRIRVVQGSRTIRFRDHDYRRIGELAAAGAPHFDDIALFTVPEETKLDPVQPWQLQLLVQRQTGALDKTFLNFDLHYRLPDRYLTAANPAPPPGAATSAAVPARPAPAEPIWRNIWRQRMPEIAIMLLALGFLTAVLFLQDVIVRRPQLIKRIRLGFLAFTVLWIGAYAHAQLSVVNVITFTGALLHGSFHWNLFLLEPLVFILWCYVAVSTLLWGRGVFCGWLCPFGALQELLSELARLLHLPQVTVRWAVHERLWPIKYILFLAIFGISLGDMALAERAAEVEPFKTVVILYCAREWPYVLYAVLVLGAGLFMERFFCRYLCPLGASLTWPGRLHMFEWRKRRKECGACRICANECMVQAIHPDGHIDANECLYCLDCQATYHNDHKCPPLIQQRLKKGRYREAPRPTNVPARLLAPDGPKTAAEAAAPTDVGGRAPVHDRRSVV